MDLIWRLREPKQKGAELLPIRQLCRGQSPVHAEVPVASCELQNGDLLVGTIGK